MSTTPNLELISDGSIDWKRWNETECRVLYLVKEVNVAVGKNWNLLDTKRRKWGSPKYKL